MSNLFLTIPTKTKILILGLLLVILFTTTLLVSNFFKEDRTVTKRGRIFPLQKTLIGQSIDRTTGGKLDIKNQEATEDGRLIFSLNSQNPLRADQVITKDDKVIFERIYIPESKSDPNHLLISTVIAKYGQPEKIFKGSRLWGHFVTTYIYSGKGVAFIGNPNTDEVYELQIFEPVSVEEYIQKYGDDINQSPQRGES